SARACWPFRRVETANTPRRYVRLTARGSVPRVIDDGAGVLARVDRGGVVEAVHAGHAVALGADGAPLVRAGDPDGPFLPRSSLKRLRAVAMRRPGVRPGAPGRALAGASHEGEPAHVEGVLAILGR